MKFNYIIFLFFTLFTVNICAFINSKYIKDLSNIAELDLELKKSNITSGMILIYSTGCGHCHHFLPTYELLANKYTFFCDECLFRLSQTHASDMGSAIYPFFFRWIFL